MDQKQRAAAYRLLAAIEANEITKDDASPYARSMDCLFLMGWFFLSLHIQISVIGC